MLEHSGESFDDDNGQCAVGVRLVAKRSNIKLEVWTTSNSTADVETLTKACAQLLFPLIDLGKPAAEFEVNAQEWYDKDLMAGI